MRDRSCADAAFLICICRDQIVICFDVWQGHAYNTFPTMNGQWVPDGILLLDPWWRNLFENTATVQVCTPHTTLINASYKDAPFGNISLSRKEVVDLCMEGEGSIQCVLML